MTRTLLPSGPSALEPTASGIRHGWESRFAINRVILPRADVEAGASTRHGFDRATLVEQRIRAWVQVADDHRTAIRVDELSDLLPSEGPGSRDELEIWLATHPAHGLIVGDRVVAVGTRPSEELLADRRARGEAYRQEATALWDRELARARPLVLAANVTGSTAYGEPEEGDDLDFMVVTRTGSVWVFLAFAYLALRLTRQGGSASPCLNYVLDQATADSEFRDSRGVMFAREALTARPVVGESYYRSMVASAPWMRAELPRLYERWLSVRPASAGSRRPAPWPVRALNALIYPALASYLQLQGLVRNRRFARSGKSSATFRTVTGLGRLTFESAHFDRLRSECDLTDGPSSRPR
jgi:hypothetical protein